MAASAREGECHYTALGSLHFASRLSQATTNARRVGDSRDGAHSPPGRAPAEIHVQVRLGKLLHETIDKKKRVTPLVPQDQAAFLVAARTRPASG